MNGKLILIVLVVIVLATAWLLVATDTANAQNTQSADRDLAQREGLAEVELDASKLPGALEYALVIGSIIAAVGVVKFA